MEIIEKVKALNTKANNLNKQREKALWERNKAKEELTKAIADYKAKYGVELTEEKIAEEYNTVLKDITAKAEKLEKDIKTIESGGSIGSTVSGGNAVNGSNVVNALNAASAVLKDIAVKAGSIDIAVNGGNSADAVNAVNGSNAETAANVGNGANVANNATWTTNTAYDQYNTNNGGNGVNGASGFNPYMEGGVNGGSWASGSNGSYNAPVSNPAPVTTPTSNPQPQNSGTTFEEWQAKMLGFDKKEEVEKEEKKSSTDGFNPQFDFRKYID